MTRWARGGTANRKKPLDASDWSELKSTGASDGKNKSDITEQSNDVKLKKPDDKVQKSRKRPTKTADSEHSVVAELEKLGKEAGLICRPEEKIQLEEFVHKDKRREARRLKRQEMKLQTRVCFNCRQKGHDLASCPQVVGDVDHGTGVCFKCGSTEHKLNQCRVKVANGKLPFAKCFICGEVGHLSRSCPDNPRGLYPHGGGCNHCGSVEHFQRDCPELQKKKGVEEVTLTTFDSKTSVDEEPSLKRSRIDKPASKKTKVVKF